MSFHRKKPKWTRSMELQNVSSEFISRFHFHYSPHSTERKWCLFAIQKITKAIFATPTKQFLLPMKSFHEKNQITEQHGITERQYCVYLTFSFSLFTSFNRQEVMFVCDSKDNKSYLRDTNKTIFASRWRVFFKNPHNSAAWSYRTCVMPDYEIFPRKYIWNSRDTHSSLRPNQKFSWIYFAYFDTDVQRQLEHSVLSIFPLLFT